LARALCSAGPRRGAAGAPAGQAAGGGRSNIPTPDFTTTERLDHVRSPSATGGDAFFEFLFSHAPVKYADLKKKAEAREPLPAFRLDGVTLTFDINTDYEIVRTRLTQNVVGLVEGSDPQLKQTYVAFGAHYDHVGYAEGEVATGAEGLRRNGAPGVVTPGAESDRIWNGADDDGSGTVTLMALARAYSLGPRPKRSMLFVWHAGEENGRWGSLLYFVDHPTVNLDRIVAQLNVDRSAGTATTRQRGEYRLSGRIRSHQLRARYDCAGANQSPAGAGISTTSSTIRPIPSRSTFAATTTATRPGAFR
jgi:hypothetical protein